MEETKEEKMTECQEKAYANLLCGFMFKRMFCSEANKDVLIWFLNMVLEDVDIKSVDFIPSEHLGLTEEDRKVIFDISCECTDGKTFIIEMQKGYQKYFRERALYYTTYPINAQGRKARELYEAERIEGRGKERFVWDYNLKPVIVVALLNFEFKHSEDWPKDMELGRFNKQISELETPFEKWIYLLKHMHNMKGIPAEFNEPLFKRLFLLAEIGNFTPGEMEQYYKSLNNMGDYYNIIHTAKEEAERIGLEKGLVQGRAEERAAIISLMSANGMDDESISKMLEMDLDEVKRITSSAITGK